ncbi:hypothetical protein [Nocardia sp. NPDC049526]|uniref:hypothetical protein n=1 Tax=Nocardia sp. NPDC049526 TaxID=3364316 RepID=UPI0037B876FF
MTAQMDGRAITNPENAQNFSHAEIKQAADQMNPDGLDGAFDAWAAIAAAVTKAGQQFETAIQQAVDQHWEGAAADRAVRGIREYAARVGELGESLDQQSTPLSAAVSAAGRFKVAVPPVVDSSDSARGPELRNSQEEQARDDMSTFYIQPYGSTAPLIPTLPPPADPISGVSGVPGTGVSPGASGESGMAGDTGKAEGTSGVGDTSPAEGAGKGGESGKTGNTGTTEGSGGAGDTGKAEDTSGAGNSGKAEATSGAGDAGKTEDTGKAGDPSNSADTVEPDTSGRSETVASQSISSAQNNGSSTIPASFTHTSTTSAIPSAGTQISPTSVTSGGIGPGTSTPTGASPGSGSAPGPGSAPSLGGVPNTGENPSPGKSVPGTTPGATTAQPTTSTPSRVGATGAAGYSGMFPPGARGRRGADGEHKSAKYLRTEEHGEELIGEVEKTVPPVLGAQ